MKKYIIIVEDKNWQTKRLIVKAKDESDLENKLTLIGCVLVQIEETKPTVGGISDGKELKMEKMLLETLNNYAALYVAGNANVLPAIGRIREKLEAISGKKVIPITVNGKQKYVLK